MQEHQPPSAAERNRQTRIVAIVGAVVNLLLSVVKIVIGYIGQSQALIVDGIHSLSDLLSDALVLFASHHASQEPDADHPYGHGRFETAATLALGVLLLLVAIGIGWEAVERLLSDEVFAIPTTIAIYAALFSILANEGLFWYTLIIGNKIHSNMLKANAWHHRSDAVSSVVVLVGIIGAQLGFVYLDTVAALVVALMIAKIGWSLGWQALEELVDTALDEEEVNKIDKVITAVDGVHSIHMLRTRKSGHQSSADVHILVDPWLSVSEGHMIAVAVEQNLKTKVRHMADVTVHIDPEDDETAPPCEGLPLRGEAIGILEQAWKDILCVFKRERMSLHYLSGRIDIDLQLPLECYTSLESTTEMQQLLKQKISEDERFGKVRIFYKAP
ncbi:MAG: cation diffusion facilitator family transporter [Chromatiales bacterium]|jgi:cation diffusion facilitator family transporter